MINNYEIWKMVKRLEGDFWDEYLEDIEAYGNYCGSCRERTFTSQGKLRKHQLVCNDCTDFLTFYTCPKGQAYYLYGLYDDGYLAYIGITNSPGTRLQSHIRDKSFNFMVIVKGFKDKATALRYEAYAIDLHKPPLNKQIPKPHESPTRGIKAIRLMEMKGARDCE